MYLTKSVNPGSVLCRPFKCQPFLSCLSDYIEHLIFKQKKQNIHTKPYIFMKLTCLAFQIKKYLDVKILNGGSRDLKYKMAAKFLGIRQCLPDDF